MKTDPPKTASPGSEPVFVREYVQHACTSNFSGIVRVTIVGDIGYLYFRRGVIIHAATLDSKGDEAALRMLRWGHCRWDPCVRPWPAEQSVFLSWVELFQRAGEMPASESTRPPPTPTAVTPPPRLADATPVAARVPLLRPLGRAKAEPPPLNAGQTEALAALSTDFAVIDANGRTHSARGDAERLVELACFTWQLADRIGALIGAGSMVALDVTYDDHSLLLGQSGTNKLALTVGRDGEVERAKAALKI